MSASKRPPSLLPGWPVIATEEELDEHEVCDPAYLLIPPALVRPIFIWLRALPLPNDVGELCRGIELLLVGLGEPDSRAMVSAADQITRSLRRLILTAQLVFAEEAEEEPPVVPLGDGEPENVVGEDASEGGPEEDGPDGGADVDSGG